MARGQTQLQRSNRFDKYFKYRYSQTPEVQKIIGEEIRLRTRLTMAAYAYEFDDDSIMSDGEFDELCLQVQPQQRTGDPLLDKFFRDHFSAHTGSWVRKHPDLPMVEAHYHKYSKRSISPAN